MKRERPVDERGDRKGLVKREKAASNRTLPLEAALRGTRDQVRNGALCVVAASSGVGAWVGALFLTLTLASSS